MRGATPLVDLLFLLLFSLLALSDTKKATSQEPVRIKLPKVAPAKTLEAGLRPTIILEINADSEVRIQDNAEVIEGPEELDRLLDVRLDGKLADEFEIEIHGDANARHGVGVALLQHLRQRGFAGVTLLALGEDDASWTGEDR